jgi:hypothetical protein
MDPPPQVVLENVRYLAFYPFSPMSHQDTWPLLLTNQILGMQFKGSMTLPYWDHTKTLLRKYKCNVREIMLQIGPAFFTDKDFDDFIFAMMVLGPSVQSISIDCMASDCKTGIAAISVIKRFFSNLEAVTLTGLDEGMSEYAMEREDWSCWTTLQRLDLRNCQLG